MQPEQGLPLANDFALTLLLSNLQPGCALPILGSCLSLLLLALFCGKLVLVTLFGLLAGQFLAEHFFDLQLLLGL